MVAGPGPSAAAAVGDEGEVPARGVAMGLAPGLVEGLPIPGRKEAVGLELVTLTTIRDFGLEP